MLRGCLHAAAHGDAWPAPRSSWVVAGGLRQPGQAAHDAFGPWSVRGRIESVVAEPDQGGNRQPDQPCGDNQPPDARSAVLDGRRRRHGIADLDGIEGLGDGGRLVGRGRHALPAQRITGRFKDETVATEVDLVTRVYCYL